MLAGIVPRRIMGLAGPIEVVMVDGELRDDDGNEAFGLSDYGARRISLSAAITSPAFLLRVFEHERVHFTLHDLGLHEDFTSRQIEKLCWGFATARMHEAYYGTATPPDEPPLTFH